MRAFLVALLTEEVKVSCKLKKSSVTLLFFEQSFELFIMGKFNPQAAGWDSGIPFSLTIF